MPNVQTTASSPVEDEGSQLRTVVPCAEVHAAKALFGTTDVVGRQLLARVDLRTGGHTAYMPFAQQYYGNVTIVARARNDGDHGRRIK